MAKRGRKPSLSKLEQRKAEIASQIKELKRAERKEQAALERERYAIIGRALAKELASNETLAAQMDPIIAKRVTKAKERKLLGLEPLSKQTPSAGQ